MKFRSPRQIAIQVILWSAGWIVLSLLLYKEPNFDMQFWGRTLLMAIAVGCIVFVNLRWLLPYFYLRENRLIYLVLSVVLLFAVVWSIHADVLPWNRSTRDFQIVDNQTSERQQNLVYPQDNNTTFRWLLRNMPPLVVSLLGSSFFALSSLAREKEQAAAQQERAKLEAELKFLKSQINPHFLFNALHNIYALTVMQSELASEQILKLSDMLRYMLYTANEDRVPLTREVDYLENYLSLAKLKDAGGMNVRFDVDLGSKELTIAPLIFIPFVENAFKHSRIEDLDNGYIHIRLKSQGDELTFELDNSKPQDQYTKDAYGGIGLNNVQQRLKLLYPDQYTLNIQSTETTYHVALKLSCT